MRSHTPASLLLTALLIGALPACSWMPFFGKDDDAAVETSEQMLYRVAERSLRTGNFTDAITRFSRLEARFPFGRYAEQAQLELVYANYMAWNMDAARLSAERFIRLHPQHPNVDYAYYMRGLTALGRDSGLLDRLFKVDLARRDVTDARNAFRHFSQFVEMFPRSEYAKDARQRMIHLRNILAASEVNIALYYMSRGAFVAAANRSRFVVENFSQTPTVPDALAILVETNWRLGLTDSANDALRVLALNYPQYQGFDEDGNLVLDVAARNEERSWVNLVSLGLLDRPEVPPPLEIRLPDAPQPRISAADSRE